MPNDRRYFVPGGTYFFTLRTEKHLPVFGDDATAELLGIVMREAKHRWPYQTVAAVLLPDHVHLIWTLPRGDASCPTRLGWIKQEFVKRYLSAGGDERPVSRSRRQNRRRGVWQRRFWEHLIQSEDELRGCVDYVHYNPAKQGYVTRPADWRWSSFHRWVARGEYPEDWGRSFVPTSIPADLETGE